MVSKFFREICAGWLPSLRFLCWRRWEWGVNIIVEIRWNLAPEMLQQVVPPWERRSLLDVAFEGAESLFPGRYEDVF